MRSLLLALACALILIGVTVARPAKTPGPLMRDFEAYWSAGATVNAHADPYGRAIWSAEQLVPGVDATHDELLPFISPPSTLALWSALARLPFQSATPMWYVVLLIALGALIVVSLRGAGEPVTFFSFLGALALAIGFGPVTGNLALGQVAISAFAGAACAVVTRPLWLKVLASFVAFFQPNIAAGLISQLGRNRTTLAVLLGAACSYFAGTLFLGWSWPARYLADVWSHERGERFGAIQYTPAALAYGLHLVSPIPALLTALCAAGAIAAAIALWRRLNDPFERFAAFSALTPFVATFFHEHDLVAAFPAAIWCAVRTQGANRAIGLAGTLLVAVDWFGLAQRSNALEQSAFLAAGATAAFLALGKPSPILVTTAAAVPVAALFATGAWLGSGHPAPMWPFSLGSFHAPPAMPIATVWFLEQQRSGLEAAIPAWAVLRSFALLGCALLAFAIYRRPSCYRTATRCSDGSS